MYGAATGESRLVALDTLLDGVTAADVMTTDVDRVTAETSLTDLATRMMNERRTTFLVTDEDGAVAGAVSLEGFKRGRGQATTVQEVMDADVPRISGETPLFDVLGSMNRDRANAAVVEENGEIRGIITSTGLATALQIRREAGSAVPPRVAM